MQRFITEEQLARVAAEPLVLREALGACRGLPSEGFLMLTANGTVHMHVGPNGIHVCANHHDDDMVMRDDRDGLDRLRAAMRRHGMRPEADGWVFYDTGARMTGWRDLNWRHFADALARARAMRQCACGRALVHGPGMCFMCVLDNWVPTEPTAAE